MIYSAGGTMAVAGHSGGSTSFAYGCAVVLHALLTEEAPLSGQRQAS